MLSLSMVPHTAAFGRPLGAGGNVRLRLLAHHAPIAVVSAIALTVFLRVSLFDASRYAHADITTSVFPTTHVGSTATPTGETDARDRIPHGAEHGGAVLHAGHGSHGVRSSPDASPGGRGGIGQEHASQPAGRGGARAGARQWTFATGYAALGLLALTLLVGPANLLLRRRTPVSNYLSRDLGLWAMAASVAHVVLGFEVHGSGAMRDWLHYFVAADGRPLTNSFGLANWTGLGGLLVGLTLLAVSNDRALATLKASRWKRIQRLNYGLFGLVILHAVFYGALLRARSPFTRLLAFSLGVVLAGQVLGILLWRRRHAVARTPHQSN